MNGIEYSQANTIEPTWPRWAASQLAAPYVKKKNGARNASQATPRHSGRGAGAAIALAIVTCGSRHALRQRDQLELRVPRLAGVDEIAALRHRGREPRERAADHVVVGEQLVETRDHG